MCGICLSEQKIPPETKELIKRRGREFYREIQHGNLFLVSSVLSLRSSVSQPVIGTEEFIFQYNGEIYNSMESDTVFISDVISETISTDLGQTDHCLVFLDRIYSKINEFENELALAIVYKNHVLFFRDDVGKRSFGYSNSPFFLSSVEYTTEIDPMKLYAYDLNEKKLYWRFKERKGIVKLYFDRFDSIRKYLGSEKYQNLYSFLNGYDTAFDGCMCSGECNNNTKSYKTVAIHNVNKLHKLLFRSFNLRKCDLDPVIFFSGGIDSLVVAIYTHITTNSDLKIILINTAVPGSFDREYGLRSFQKLKDVFPSRNFKFVENNLEIDRINEHKEKIQRLLRPKISANLWMTTTMDFNISCVLYFSALCAVDYGKVVYLGSGADEIFGGYHKYNKADGREHMLFDLFTIATHNISRDDRMIGNWSVEARFPLLDYEIIKFSFDLPSKSVVNKKILRDLLEYHGFEDLSKTAKKAMQFGTGMSKISKDLFRDSSE